MGYLKDRYGFTMAGDTPPGTCPECGVVHAPEMPHNPQSLAYQYKFYDKNGRWANWADAMTHCSQFVKDAWTSLLMERGIDINDKIETIEVGIDIHFGKEAGK